jgi:TonB-dependent starch-binding outer membrane protein SusC
LQNLAIGYSLPALLILRVKMTRLRIYASAQNLFAITSYNKAVDYAKKSIANSRL